MRNLEFPCPDTKFHDFTLILKKKKFKTFPDLWQLIYGNRILNTSCSLTVVSRKEIFKEVYQSLEFLCGMIISPRKLHVNVHWMTRGTCKHSCRSLCILCLSSVLLFEWRRSTSSMTALSWSISDELQCKHVITVYQYCTINNYLLILYTKILCNFTCTQLVLIAIIMKFV